jgi:peptidylprolyl isomerase
MIRALPLLAAALLAAPLSAADKPATFPSPGEIVAAAPAAEWQRIAAEDLLVMDLVPGAKGEARRVVIQLMPAPFSQGWVGNIRKLAAAHWWDGLSVYRVQDGYVTQWGDADGEDKAKARPLPAGLAVVPESAYTAKFAPGLFRYRYTNWGRRTAAVPVGPVAVGTAPEHPAGVEERSFADAYTANVGFASGFPVAMSYAAPTGYRDPMTASGVDQPDRVWPVHCYGMVGVARDMSPDTGTGAELYTVIGHAPRHLDRNIALVGRVIEGMQWLSSLPRGPAPMGVYTDPADRTEIVSVRLASELPAAEQPRFEYLSTEGETFAKYADAVANRRDPFFIQPAGGADICNVRVPVRRSTSSR